MTRTPYEQARKLAEACGDDATLSAVLNNIAPVDFSRGRIEAVAVLRWITVQTTPRHYPF